MKKLLMLFVVLLPTFSFCVQNMQTNPMNISLNAIPQKTPPIPEGVIIQSVTIENGQEKSGYRLFFDGRYQSMPYGRNEWIFLENLSEVRLDSLEKLIEETDFGHLKPYYAGNNTDSRQLYTWIQCRHSGKEYNIRIDNGAVSPDIDVFNQKLIAIFRN